MRAAVWTPLPPERSGIADYSYDLLAELCRELDVTAVVRDGVEAEARAPAGVEVIPASGYDPSEYAVDFYHMGNHARFHSYIHRQAFRRPGILVLHDPALVDFYKRLAGGEDKGLFRAEAFYNCPELTEGEDLPTIEVGGKSQLDPMKLLLSRRLVEASALTIAHSTWARDELLRRSPEAQVVWVPEAALLLAPEALDDHLERRVLQVLVLGGISRPKRVPSVIRSFCRVRDRLQGARLLVVGRSDEPDAVREIEEHLAETGTADVIELRQDVSEEELNAALLSCDLVVSLRWPTTGETSAAVMRALGAGRLVIGSDVPQHRDLDERFYWRIPTDSQLEGPALESALVRAANERHAVAEAGLRARRYVEQRCTFEHVAAEQARLARQVAGRPIPMLGGVSARHLAETPAVNAIASWEATTGITEAARRAVGGLIEAGVRVALEDFDFGAPKERGRFPQRLRVLPRGRPYGIDLIFLNVNELHVASERYLRYVGDRRYVIGSWFWELPEIPAHVRSQIERVDEIWVATEFVASVFRSLTDKPVHVMPCVVEPVADPSPTRRDFGLAEERVVYLFGFDANSTLARKNPRAVVEAYVRAFSALERRSEVQLLVKTMNLASLPEANDLLASLLERAGGIIIDEELTPGEMAALTSLCDVYVSLHRAEGFGLGLAEAMYFGKPVIATGYSGNLDFMSPSNSCLVGYQMTRITQGDLRFNPHAQHVYPPGALWAEPNVEEASRWMRHLYEHPELRKQLGRVAEKTIRERSSPGCVGRLMRRRLESIHRSMGRAPSATEREAQGAQSGSTWTPTLEGDPKRAAASSSTSGMPVQAAAAGTANVELVRLLQAEVETKLQARDVQCDSRIRLIESDVGPLLFPTWDRVMAPAIEATGSWEPAESTWIRQHVPEGALALDVGANVGYHAITLARAVGPSGRVVALEPDPLNFELLLSNLRLNDVKNVRAINVAAGQTGGTVEFTRDPSNPGDHRCYRRPGAQGFTVIRVPMVTLDSVLAADDRVDFALIDTQSYDHRVIAGMDSIVRRSRPSMLVEFWIEGLNELGDDPIEVIRGYRDLGYVVRVLDYPEASPDLRPAELVALADGAPGHYVTLVLTGRLAD